VNSFLVLGLVELQATEAAPLMERAFRARKVDPMIMGDWEDVQVELGLPSAEAIEQRIERLQGTPLPSAAQERTAVQLTAEERRHHEAAHKKARNKLAKASRKKNRKR
jgi:hypothetical protein